MTMLHLPPSPWSAPHQIKCLSSPFSLSVSAARFSPLPSSYESNFSRKKESNRKYSIPTPRQNHAIAEFCRGKGAKFFYIRFVCSYVYKSICYTLFMDEFMRVGLIIFTFYSPFFLFLIFLATKKYEGYSFRLFWMSNLGDTRYQSSTWFIPAFVLYGGLSLFLPYNLSKIISSTQYSTPVISLLYICSISTIAANLIPINKNSIVHHLFTCIVFLGTNVVYFLLLPFLLSSLFIPRYVIIFTIFLIGMSIIYSFSFAGLIYKEKKIPLTLGELRKSEHSFFVRNISVLEWIIILSVILWNFTMSLTIL